MNGSVRIIFNIAGLEEFVVNVYNNGYMDRDEGEPNATSFGPPSMAELEAFFDMQSQDNPVQIGWKGDKLL